VQTSYNVEKRDRQTDRYSKASHRIYIRIKHIQHIQKMTRYPNTTDAKLLKTTDANELFVDNNL